MAKKIDADKLIADQAKENAALKAKIAQKEARATRDLEEQVDWSNEILNAQRKYNDALDASKKAQKEIRDLTAEINEWIEYTHVNKGKITKEEKKEAGLLIKNYKLQRDQAKEINKQFIKLQKIADIEKQAIPYRKKHLEAQQKLNKLTDKYNGSVDKSLDFIDSIDDKIKEIPIVGDFLSKAIGLDKIKEELTDKFTGYLTKSLDPAAAKQAETTQAALKGYDDQIAKLNGVSDATEDVSENSEKISGGMSKATKAAKGLKFGLGAALGVGLALAAVVELFKFGLELDQEISDLAKGMGMTRHEAEEAHHQFLKIAKTTNVIGANEKALVAANQDLNAILGTNAIASDKMLETQVLLTKQYGLTGAEAAEFQAVSAGTGKTVEQNLATVETMVKGYNTMTGDSMNFKEISKDIAKTSKATLASYKGDVKALTLAAIQAKKMGMSLEETQQVADKLLDIESSIESEMKANVLTGKHMNMNKARQLALEGDSAAAAAEAVAQAGSLEELNEMNIIQRKSIAEAAGVTVDQLMKSAELQKFSNALNGAEVKDMKDLTKEQIQQLKVAGAIEETRAEQMIKEGQIASTQEKLAATMDKVKATFADIVSGPLGTLMSGIGSILSNSSAMKGVLVAVGIIMAGLAVSAIATMSALTLGIGGVAIAAGIATAAVAATSQRASAEESAKKVDDAQIDPDGGLIVQGKEGKYQLNKNDSIVAGTNLGSTIKDSAPIESEDTGILGGLASAMSAPFEAVGSLLSGGNDNSEVVALLKELIAKVEQPVMVNIGGRVVDEMEKQTSLRKTYNTKMDSGYGTFG